ncbi:Permuted papain-like amidase enzyme, YaeF/YiiX, C92 family [Rhizobium sp. AN5]|uniref:hypothetical protein n=1 Tax=Rhizobium sp. AN5 TaxID=1855304 RepID=UPI000BC88442|nr:hypothetical protein [Rhizobium sp. AN5]SOC91758.1 Permuted papain-like amidase enzyme, YaeF/YiiX, C92 family [Rhizobium sp. AN5]
MKTLSQSPVDRISEGYAFNCGLIREGDILLCTDPDDIISKAIRRATGRSILQPSNFSHAAICTFRPLFIEADFFGVAEFSLDRKNLAQKRSARILRLKSSVPRASEIAKAAAEIAVQYQAKRYDKIAAVASIFGGAKATTGIFCSYLVSAAYLAAGLNIAPHCSSPSATTPADIELSPDFEDITDQVLLRARFSEGLTYYFLDRPPQFALGEKNDPDAPSPAQAYNIALREVGERISRFLEKRKLPPAASYLEAQEALARYESEAWFPELDALFARSIRELALPRIREAGPTVSLARGRDELHTARVLSEGAVGEEDLQFWVNNTMHRINTTQRLIEDRENSIHVFGLGVQTTGWHTLRAWIECEQEICDGLHDNLRLYARQIALMHSFAVAKDWKLFFGEDGYCHL